ESHERRVAGRIAALLGTPAVRPGIGATPYDTAWLASVPAEADPRSPRFPECLQWLVDHQRTDGSWGGDVRYEHDRVVCTLGALVPLATFGRRAEDARCVAAGTRYLWQRAHRLASEPVELVAFELLLPALVRRAQQAGIPVPPNLDLYQSERADKLRLIPPEALYSPGATVAHSLEFLGEQAHPDGLRAAQGRNGAIGNSPAATAFYLALSNDPRARAYLQECLFRTEGVAAPVLYPCETFELLWAAYPLFLAGVSPRLLLDPAERAALADALQSGGVSLSPSFPIPDADDTAVALLLLHELGEPVDPGVLQRFALPGGHFASFPRERHPSVGVNLHVLHALLRVPGYPDRDRVIGSLLDFLIGQQIGSLYWLDKWHVSPYYATAHAIRVFAELPAGPASRVAPFVTRAREWLRQTQTREGGWGFYGAPTVEETAYAVLALTAGDATRRDLADRRACAAGVRYLKTALDRAGGDRSFPALWIDKCLYTPPLVVRAAIEAARLACLGRWRAAGPILEQAAS
ncbi:MAG: hypothetical protein ACRDIY_03230, partial [Chloroflexota bacterium]